MLQSTIRRSSQILLFQSMKKVEEFPPFFMATLFQIEFWQFRPKKDLNMANYSFKKILKKTCDDKFEFMSQFHKISHKKGLVIPMF
jgi:hypothetical protein